MANLLLARLIFGGLLLTKPCFALEFSQSYQPEVVPERSRPCWARSGGTEVDVVDGVLKVTTPARGGFGWAIGTEADGTEVGDGSIAWKADPAKGSTIDFSFSIEGDEGAGEGERTFMIRVRDGQHSWEIPFWPHQLQIYPHSPIVAHDVRKRDTYRITIKDGLMNLYSARDGVLLVDVKPLQTSTANGLEFFSPMVLDAQTTVLIYGIHWTNEEAATEGPSPLKDAP